jgi:voltage-gated potassium channel
MDTRRARRRDDRPVNTSRWRQRIYEVIFEADTFEGKLFDVLLLINISLSVIVVMLESSANIRADYYRELFAAEWFFTILFSIEYILRMIAVRRRIRYALSFYGLVDLLAVVPTYLSLLFPGSQYFLVIRVLRLLRIFRVLKMGEYLSEADYLWRAIQNSRRKILVFLMTVLALVIIVGAMMYVIEGPQNGYIDIPTSIYWAIVTLTTVGYGDLAPQTALGKMLASLVMLTGYGIIAVPTGIVTAELTRVEKKELTTQVCPNCGREDHDIDALYCKYCGELLNEPAPAVKPSGTRKS